MLPGAANEAKLMVSPCVLLGMALAHALYYSLSGFDSENSRLVADWGNSLRCLK